MECDYEKPRAQVCTSLLVFSEKYQTQNTPTIFWWGNLNK